MVMLKVKQRVCVKIVTKCPFCGEIQNIVVPKDSFFKWQAGEVIQKAMPELSAEKREALISGICPKCWETIQ